MMIAWLTLPVMLATVTTQTFEVAPRENLSVEISGSGGEATVLLVPGLSGCNYGFRKVEPLLHERGLATVAVEPLGLGLSDRTPDADYSLTAQAGRLARVLDDLGITGALVVSQGVSTSMVMRLALMRPDLVAGIVSVEGGAAESACTPTVQRGLKLAKFIAKLGGGQVLRDRYADDLRRASGDDSWLDKRTVRRYFHGPGRDIQSTLNVFLNMSRQTEPEDLVPHLPDLAVPVVVLQGTAEHEGALEPDEIEVMREGLPDFELRAVPGAGHFIYEEQPEAVAAAVGDLWRRIEKPRP